MTEFTIAEDFPKSEIEFDQRFSKPEACFDYLFKQKWPDGFVRGLKISVPLSFYMADQFFRKRQGENSNCNDQNQELCHNLAAH